MSDQLMTISCDILFDPKWRTIARISGQPISAVISVYLFALSGAVSREPFRDEDVASALDLEEGQVEAILHAMGGRIIDADGKIIWRGQRT
jgi:hypothetical protein